MRNITMAPLLACLALAACGGSATTTSATISTDTTSALDAAVQGLTQIDKGIVIYARTQPAGSALVAKLVTDAHAARTALLKAQADASQAAAALAAFQTVSAEFAAL